MSEGTQPRMARGTMLSAGIAAVALLALLVFAPLASAASDPVGSGTATVTINSGFKKGLAKKGVSFLRVAPTTIKGSKLTLKITGGKIDPTTGKGSVNFGGGLKFKAGKKSVVVKKLVLNNTKSVLGAKLTANVGGKNMVFGTVVGQKASRNGFNVKLTIKQLKLTSGAAGQLNKKLGLTGKAKAFKGNRVMGSVKSEVKLATIHVKAGGTASLLTNLTTVGKFAGLKVGISPIEPAKEKLALPPEFTFPVLGGSVNSTATAGVIETAGGIKLENEEEVEPDKEKAPGQKTKFTLLLNGIFIDLSAKAGTVEVTINSSNPLFQQGPLGRSSIADVSLVGATVTSDPKAHTVTVTNATATLQALTAAVLNSTLGAGKGETFKAGDPLGTFSFTVTTE